MTTVPPRDPGLQAERTSLAWRRTALALAVGSVAAARVLPEHFGWWTIVPALVGLAFSAVTFVVAHQRYARHTTRVAQHEELTDHRGAAIILATAMLSVTLSVACLVMIILG